MGSVIRRVLWCSGAGEQSWKHETGYRWSLLLRKVQDESGWGDADLGNWGTQLPEHKQEKEEALLLETDEAPGGSCGWRHQRNTWVSRFQGRAGVGLGSGLGHVSGRSGSIQVLDPGSQLRKRSS